MRISHFLVRRYEIFSQSAGADQKIKYVFHSKVVDTRWHDSFILLDRSFSRGASHRKLRNTRNHLIQVMLAKGRKKIQRASFN